MIRYNYHASISGLNLFLDKIVEIIVHLVEPLAIESHTYTIHSHHGGHGHSHGGHGDEDEDDPDYKPAKGAPAPGQKPECKNQ